MSGFSWRVKQYASARMAVGIKSGIETQREKERERGGGERAIAIEKIRD